MHLLNEIKNSWKLDAKSENTDRFFFHVAEVESIKSGDRAYVIGRKGTGKSAIAQYLSNIKSHDTFSTMLSFKNFPFNDLYALKNSGFTAPNQYITLWKYLIYCNVAKMMATNEAIDAKIREPLAKLYGPEPLEYLAKSVGKWTATDFNFSILGIGAGAKRSIQPPEINWIERTNALEQLIAQHIDDSQYLIVFDELDEDYLYMHEADRYRNFTNLLTGLFKAVQDIKSIFRNTHARITPVIFLRDDIFDILQDPDKTKWDDAKIDLDWSTPRLKELLAFRISRTKDPSIDKSMSFDEAWALIFRGTTVSYGKMQQKRQSVLDYILKSTHMRPRDVVRYLSECARISTESNTILGETLIKQADGHFSGYLKREIESEIGGVVPHAAKLFDVLSSLRKETFTLAEFTAAYKASVTTDIFKRYDPNWVLKVLFFFSVIGNQPRQVNQTVFRYFRRGAQVNFNESFVVHRGLLKALQIL
jgi:energy-coupling factor transporter ATP-binding protein EcfA2/phosphohistidine phosphatase SixA